MLTSEIVDHLEVCGACGHVRGAFPYDSTGEVRTLVQRCRCDVALGGRGAKWPGFDFNEVAALCRSCGAELLSSGSRWSVWFCSPCRDRARDVNKAAGRPIVPIGRHSIMHGISLSGPPSREAIDVFVPRFKALFDRMPVVEGWAHDVVRMNIHDAGLPPDAPLPIHLYLDSVRRIDRNARFDGLLERLVESVERR